MQSRQNLSKPAVGNTYAYRKGARTLGEPVIPAEVIRHGPPRSRKVRVKYLSGEYEGLEEWVPDVRLVADWADAEALLRDERALLSALETSGNDGQGPYREPVDLVLAALAEALGAELVCTGWSGPRLDLVTIKRFAENAVTIGLDPEAMLREAGAYVNRFGDYWAPFNVAVAIAKHICGRYRDAVIGHVAREQHSYAQKIIDADNNWDRDFWGKELDKFRTTCLIVGDWCGADLLEQVDENALLRAEVDRLRRIVQDLADWLRNGGHSVKAGLVMKDLKPPT